MRNTMVVVGLGLSALLALPGTAFADPPTRVARASYIAGEASIRHGTADEWVPFIINYVATTGDEVWSGDDSRTELHVGSSALRLSARTDVVVTELEDDRALFSLNQGTLELRLRSIDHDDNWRVQTPVAALTFVGRGAYRVSVNERDNSMTLIVRDGGVRVESARGTFDVQAGQAVYVRGGDRPTYEVRDLPRADDFDRWAYDRDRDEDGSEAARYVGRDMTGYESLDGHGRWIESDEYGTVWAPYAVARDWAPYRYGRWMWVDPWGWTWIDDQPWGFAPFHYGRWARYRGAWVWAPGRRVARPVYAPALVAFVGGGGWSATVRFGAGGGVAWFPLAPGEAYVPAYHVSDRYARDINYTTAQYGSIQPRSVDVGGMKYRNMREEGAVTAVSRESFRAARPARGHAVTVEPREIEHQDVVSHGPPVAPVHGEIPRATAGGRGTMPRSEPNTLPPAVQRSDPSWKAQPAAVEPDRRQERKVEERQLVEDTRMQDRHQQERQQEQRAAAPAPARVNDQAIRQRQVAEQQQQEARHQQEIKQLQAATKPAPRAAPAPAPAPASKEKEHGKPPGRQR